MNLLYLYSKYILDISINVVLLFNIYNDMLYISNSKQNHKFKVALSYHTRQSCKDGVKVYGCPKHVNLWIKRITFFYVACMLLLCSCNILQIFEERYLCYS